MYINIYIYITKVLAQGGSRSLYDPTLGHSLSGFVHLPAGCSFWHLCASGSTQRALLLALCRPLASPRPVALLPFVNFVTKLGLAFEFHPV